MSEWHGPNMKNIDGMKPGYILIFAVLMLSVTGCDFFRKLAGRPTGAEIEVKRQEMLADKAAKAAREKAVRDSMELVLKAEKDSVQACAYIADNKVNVLDASRLGGVVQDMWGHEPGTAGYRVILGSFRDAGNADKMIRALEQVGDKAPHKILFRNGMIAVAVCPSDRIQNAVDGLKELKGHELCPADAWILKLD